jgi:hypothetical protein
VSTISKQTKEGSSLVFEDAKRGEEGVSITVTTQDASLRLMMGSFNKEKTWALFWFI